MQSVTTGRLLIAQPTMLDPNFFRAVVYVVEHGEQGAFGVIVNRPTQTPVDAVLPDLGLPLSEPAVFFEGGPVGHDSVVGLVPDATVVARLAGLESLNHPSIAREDIEVEAFEARSIVDDPATWRSMRLFAGYAGWAPHQLDVELAEGSWVVVDAAYDDVFGEHPGELWTAVLRRQGGPTARLAMYPDDVSVN